MKRITKLLSAAWISVTAFLFIDAKKQGKSDVFKNLAKGTIPVYFSVGAVLTYRQLNKIPLVPRIVSAGFAFISGIVSILIHLSLSLIVSNKLGWIDNFGIVEKEQKIDIDVNEDLINSDGENNSIQ